MDRDWRDRFHGNLDQDSKRLSVTAQALVAYLDGFEQDAGLMTPQEEFEAWVAEGRPADGPASDAARDLARDWQGQESADRAALPDADLPVGGRADVAHAAVDPVRLSVDLGLPLDLVLRRLGMGEENSGLMVCDGAGGVIFRRPARGMAPARPGDPCGMLPIFEALGQPGTPVERLIETETGLRLQAIAVAMRRPSSGLGGPTLSLGVMLLRPWPERFDTRRARGFDLPDLPAPGLSGASRRVDPASVGTGAASALTSGGCLSYRLMRERERGVSHRHPVDRGRTQHRRGGGLYPDP